jgi:hypothetical protein
MRHIEAIGRGVNVSVVEATRSAMLGQIDMTYVLHGNTSWYISASELEGVVAALGRGRLKLPGVCRGPSRRAWHAPYWLVRFIDRRDDKSVALYGASRLPLGRRLSGE